MNQKEIVTELGKQAEAIARQRVEYDEAFVRDQVARAELLEAVIGVVTPALRALGTRVAAGGKTTKEGTTTNRATFRAVQVYGEPLLMEQFGTGRPDAEAIYLTDRADLVAARYHGIWEHGGTTWTWTATFDLLTPAKAIELAGGDPAPILDRIALALEREAKGSAGAKIARLTERASRIRAAATLLRAS